LHLCQNRWLAIILSLQGARIVAIYGERRYRRLTMKRSAAPAAMIVVSVQKIRALVIGARS
jgi:hypothetical protein